MSQKLNNHSQQNICHLNTQFKKNKQARERKKETGYILEVHFPHTFSNFVSNSRKLKFRPIIVQEPLKPTSSRQTSFTQQRLTSTICIFPGYTLKSFVKSFTSLALELWSMSSSSLRWDILATTPQVLFFMDFGVHKKQPCFCNFWQLCSTRLAWSPFSLGSPGFPSAHLTNDLQLTTVLSWAPSLEFGLNYTQQKKKLYPGNLHERRKKKKKPSITNFLHSDWFQKEREKKKILGKEPVFKEHDLCRVRTARSVLLSEETPNTGQEATGLLSPRHRQPALLWQPPSQFQSFSLGQAMPKGCCQCNRTKLFEKLFHLSGEKFQQRILWPPLQFAAGAGSLSQLRQLI